LIWENVSELDMKNNKAAMIYGISGIPDNFLIDSKHFIIGRNLRNLDLAKVLDSLLN
jgi:hypothetical protein